jgi:hypothetical protein
LPFAVVACLLACETDEDEQLKVFVIGKWGLCIHSRARHSLLQISFEQKCYSLLPNA